ncbi:hypothetical protein V2A60_007036 [Cordyceps javanica]|uniref:Flavin-containing amine oxidasedehydrogenase n=1 Tax=Cordyceps javanica TaxID=43265 RepID=A0A545VRQ2_9HYPO|nr:flavin-containing amine oxidasedehydrogenase [Cordyceps javanica]TQW04411.1 flavin-containing amine oxidasedehydrogenase [Cordyceps javanica]
MASNTGKRQHIAIVGGGAAGMACAATLAQHPDKFEITLIEKEAVVGGQATSIDLDNQQHGASWMNNGVQGGSAIFKHTFMFFQKYGYPAQEVRLQVSFGKGKDRFWTNCFPSPLVKQFDSDIKRFGTFLKVIKWSLPVLGIIPISVMLKVFFFSKDFGDKMVYPLIALFLGTGNQTASVPSGIVERLFNDPNMKLWDYDSATLLPNLPTMYTFGKLHDFYSKWREDLTSKGVSFVMETEVHRTVSRSKNNVILELRNTRSKEERQETFDKVVFCSLADETLRILGKSATWREKFVLGGATFYDDITVTHTDNRYFNEHYETHFKSELCAEPTTEAQRKQIAFANPPVSDPDTGFRPMYYTYTYENNPKLIEMSFNCTNYQHQFRQNETSNEAVSKPVYQTIFLNKQQRDLWTIGQIDEGQIIKKNWWHQLGHRWLHYLRVVPNMMFIQGRNSTYFAGSWTLVNMHEVACVSGIAAAYHIGADYDKFDKFATDFFSKYLLLSHGLIFSRQEKKRRQS